MTSAATCDSKRQDDSSQISTEKSGLHRIDRKYLSDYYIEYRIDAVNHEEWLAVFDPDVEGQTMAVEYAALTTQTVTGIEERFRILRDRWKDSTYLMSSLHDMFLDQAYQSIIGLGPDVVPVILRETAQNPDHWYWALRAITGENPVPESLFGDVEGMSIAG